MAGGATEEEEEEGGEVLGEDLNAEITDNADSAVGEMEVEQD